LPKIPVLINNSVKYQSTITPKGLSLWQSIVELIKYRQLLFTFAARDYKVRYAQTYIGFWWSLLQPIASVSALFIVFQKVVTVPTNGIPYLPFALSGLILWNYFNYVITQSASSLVINQSMIRKIYFPRLCLPLSRALVGLVDPLVGLLLLIITLVATGFASWGILMFIPVLLASAIAALGIGLWASALSIRYRDLQQILPFILQIVFFLTPVAYSASLIDSLIPQDWKFLVYLNPMAGIIETFRAALYDMPLNPAATISYVMVILLFLSGITYFQKVEMKIADIV
jgi:lipopolysaccharide transport system permease protein